MVGRTAQDSKAILDIHNLLRTEMYPEPTEGLANVFLEYPPTWEIEFVDFGPDGPRNKFLPTPLECYLTSFSSTFNPGQALFRVDGSSTQIDVSLTFSETRVPFRSDIVENNPTG